MSTDKPFRDREHIPDEQDIAALPDEAFDCGGDVLPAVPELDEQLHECGENAPDSSNDDELYAV